MPVSGYLAFIEGLYQASLWEAAAEALAEMREGCGATPDTVMFTKLITSCARAGNWQQALDLLEEMKARVYFEATVLSFNKPCRDGL